jgi:hypothetical protein
VQRQSADPKPDAVATAEKAAPVVAEKAAEKPVEAPAAPAANPMRTGALSEEEFKALHTLTGEAAPKPRGEMVEIGGGQHYLSRPEGVDAPLPAVLVIHEWWGLNDHIKHYADRLAAEGYAALAVDLYGGQVATSADEAMKLMQAVDAGKASATLAAAAAFSKAPAKNYSAIRPPLRLPRAAYVRGCFLAVPRGTTASQPVGALALGSRISVLGRSSNSLPGPSRGGRSLVGGVW